MQIQKLILLAVSLRPTEWLNCAGNYIGEVLALQNQGLLQSRVVSGQLQVRALAGK